MKRLLDKSYGITRAVGIGVCCPIRLSNFVRSPGFRRKLGLPDLTNSFHFPTDARTTSRFGTLELKTHDTLTGCVNCGRVKYRFFSVARLKIRDLRYSR